MIWPELAGIGATPVLAMLHALAAVRSTGLDSATRIRYQVVLVSLDPELDWDESSFQKRYNATTRLVDGRLARANGTRLGDDVSLREGTPPSADRRPSPTPRSR